MNADIADKSISNSKLQEECVTDSNLSSGIDGAKLSDNTVVDAKIHSVSASKLLG